MSVDGPQNMFIVLFWNLTFFGGGETEGNDIAAVRVWETLKEVFHSALTFQKSQT